jgi:acetyl/propionyl-CoA carboxylase alpha subunit
MFNKILIANRGEIACRIARTLRRMGVAVATVHSSADAGALHVQEIGESVAIGEAPAQSSYLNIAAVIDAARQVGADAIHPGFGFLSENAGFARACAEAGIAFIGPFPETLELFGDKAAAKQLAQQLVIPTAGGLLSPSDDVAEVLACVRSMEMPCIVKAVAGGGGKGMRVIRNAGEAGHAISAAIREGRSSFGDGRVIVERYLSQPRHIEVQILGDGRGEVIHLFDRECTLQRRHQKVVEEAPVSSIPAALRRQLWQHAVDLGRATNYLGLGTVEFAVTEDAAVFLEVNPRLQVEHPVTELVTGLDLVEWQVRAVHDRQLPSEQGLVAEPRGFAVQARLYAEDPGQGFLPSTGRVEVFRPCASVRMDAGVAAGCEITSHYDPMMAKLIAAGQSRTEALRKLREALNEVTVLGVVSNRAFLLELLADPLVESNAISTETIDRWLADKGAPLEATKHVAALMAIWRQSAGKPGSALGSWGDRNIAGWRLRRGQPSKPHQPHMVPRYEVSTPANRWQVGFGSGAGSTGRMSAVSVGAQTHWVREPQRLGDSTYLVAVDGESLSISAFCQPGRAYGVIGEAQLAIDIQAMHTPEGKSRGGEPGTVLAPMMGLLIGVHAEEGQHVSVGDKLATLESMKMEMSITAPADGQVVWTGCVLGEKVERNQEIFRIASIA